MKNSSPTNSSNCLSYRSSSAGEEELHQLALRLGGEEHLAVGREGLPALVSGPAQGVVGVVLVDR